MVLLGAARRAVAQIFDCDNAIGLPRTRFVLIQKETSIKVGTHLSCTLPIQPLLHHSRIGRVYLALYTFV